jgi:hypothetical protein
VKNDEVDVLGGVYNTSDQAPVAPKTKIIKTTKLIYMYKMPHFCDENNKYILVYTHTTIHQS